MATTNTPIDLDGIKKRYESYPKHSLIHDDIPALVAEVERLRSALDEARKHLDSLANATDGTICNHIKNREGCWTCLRARHFLETESASTGKGRE